MRSKANFLFAFFFLAVYSTGLLKSQGCSDAGFCTMGNMKQQSEDTVTALNKISLLFPMGVGDENVFVFSPALQYDRRFSERFSVQAKLSAAYSNGSIGSAFGPGDFILSANYTANPISVWKVSITAGGKVPLSNSDLTHEGKALPMQFQSSLGTYDAIAGITLANSKLRFSAGVQVPLTKNNNNGFLPSLWSFQDTSISFPATRKFSRKADALLRAAYTLKMKSVSLNAGLLAIYHLGEDAYTNEMEQVKTIEGSDGLTLNLTLAGWWKVNKKLSIGFTAGTPLIVRKVRPDGLTRKFVFSPEISYSF